MVDDAGGRTFRRGAHPSALRRATSALPTEGRLFPPGMRLLENTVEQKKPELTKLLLPTMEEIISKAKEPYPRSRREWLEKIKKQVGEEK
jgi:hypothetical protein